MAKAKSNRDARPQSGLKSEIEKAVANPGTGGPESRVWVRGDGAVCFGDECVVVKPSGDGNDLTVEINPDACGQAAGEAITRHLIETVGRGGSTQFKVRTSLGLEKSK